MSSRASAFTRRGRCHAGLGRPKRHTAFRRNSGPAEPVNAPLNQNRQSRRAQSLLCCRHPTRAVPMSIAMEHERAERLSSRDSGHLEQEGPRSVSGGAGRRDRACRAGQAVVRAGRLRGVGGARRLERPDLLREARGQHRANRHRRSRTMAERGIDVRRRGSAESARGVFSRTSGRGRSRLAIGLIEPGDRSPAGRSSVMNTQAPTSGRRSRCGAQPIGATVRPRDRRRDAAGSACREAGVAACPDDEGHDPDHIEGHARVGRLPRRRRSMAAGRVSTICRAAAASSCISRRSPAGRSRRTSLPSAPSRIARRLMTSRRWARSSSRRTRRSRSTSGWSASER